jgi:uncharacterized membrane protein YcjF (UPF0283 family)
MQHEDATIKQSGHDEMRQGTRYNDEARRDATTRGRRDKTQRNEMTRRQDRTGRDDKGREMTPTTNQMDKQTDEQRCEATMRQEVKTRREGMEAMFFLGFLLGGAVMQINI